MLHLVDSQLLEIRNRAANLDPGKKLQAELAAINTQYEAKSAHAKALHAEQTDLELRQKSIDDKLKKIDKELYGGKVVNPREVEALQKEIATLMKNRGDMDGRILELWDEMPPAKKEADALHAHVETKKKELDEHQKKVLVARAQMEKDFKERAEKRPGLAKEVPPPMLARYEAIRHKHAPGMAGVSKKGACEACGTNQPVKLIHASLEGKVVTCEACHRILYATEGLI
jgi:predicted  nucleic acid-binding Zn-ribbon protein